MLPPGQQQTTGIKVDLPGYAGWTVRTFLCGNRRKKSFHNAGLDRRASTLREIEEINKNISDLDTPSENELAAADSSPNQQRKRKLLTATADV